MVRKDNDTGTRAFAVFLLGLIFIVAGCSSRQSNALWRLRADEILLELDGSGKWPSGIYSVQPLESDPRPQLLLSGGTRPDWSPDRHGFAFLRERLICYRDKQGRGSLLDTEADHSVPSDAPLVHWMPRDEPPHRVAVLRSQWRWCNGTLVDAGSGHTRPYFQIGPPKLNATDRVEGWRKIYSVKSLDLSPDKQKAVVEISPLAPDDLLRSHSRIYTYKASESPSLAFVGDERARGKRLTALGPGSCELEPMWSPDGRWIAFTVVRFDKEYVAPAVCRPDGTDYTELFPACARELEAGRRMARRWLPVIPLRPRSSRGETLSPIVGWGKPHVRPIEWSDDGRYLLLGRSDTIDGTAEVATYRNGRWYVGDVADQGKAGSVALGPSKAGSCLVACVDRNRTAILIFDKEKGGSKGRPRLLKRIPMPKGTSIRWLDW